MTKRILLVIAGMLLSGAVLAAGSAPTIDLGELKMDSNDQASLQRGARTFMNYCSGCHSLEYMRYERMATDIGITLDDGAVATDMLKKNLMFTSDKVGDQIHIAMRPKDSALWFGITPPDLTLETRARGNEWLYHYLKGFYVDPNKPWGVNNAVFPDVAMPHVLWELQGIQTPIYETHTVTVDNDTQQIKTLVGLQVTQQGTLTEAEYDQVVTDLVNFLAYVGEPNKSERERLGIWVILGLIIIGVFAYLLKREYWKDVH